MFKFNQKLFKKKIRESVFNVSDLCELVAISEPTYYWQMRNNTFTIESFLSMCNILGISAEELLEILKGE